MIFLTLQDQMKAVVAKYQHLKPCLQHNFELMDINEGNLLPYIDADLRDQLSLQSYMYAKQRIAPINLLTKINKKLSTIYNSPPKRTVVMVDGSEPDQKSSDLLSWYEKVLDVNSYMANSVRLFNLCKATAVQPYTDMGYPKMRVVQNDRFFVLGLDPVDPMKVTHYVTFDQIGDAIYFDMYTPTYYVRFREDLEIISNEPNDYLTIPCIYACNSMFNLMPKADTDIMKMIKLVPILLSDLNFAVMFQTFSIIYGINVDDENLKMSPNAFWRLKSEVGSEAKPEIGMLKPQVDIEQVLSLVQSELALWLNSKGIRPGAVGQLSKDNFSSGISKIVDEMDTHEIRVELTQHYQKIESEFWYLLLNVMHPQWVAQGLVENNTLFNPNALVQTTFDIPLASQSRTDLIAEVKSEREAGFTSLKRAIKKLNPMLSDEEVETLIEEINEERSGITTEDNPRDPTGATETDPSSDS